MRIIALFFFFCVDRAQICLDSVSIYKNPMKRRRVPEKPQIETISPEHYIYVTASSIFECLHLKWKFLVFLITFAPVFINSNFL